MLGRTHLGNMKRTGLDAVPAADASLAAVLDDSVRPPVKSPRGTGRNTRGIAAVETCRRNGPLLTIRKPPVDMTSDMPEPDFRGSVVLQLAPHFAGVAAYAFSVVKKNQPIIHANVPCGPPKRRGASCLRDPASESIILSRHFVPVTWDDRVDRDSGVFRERGFSSRIRRSPDHAGKDQLA